MFPIIHDPVQAPFDESFRTAHLMRRTSKIKVRRSQAVRTGESTD